MIASAEVLNALPVPVCLTDAEGVITYFNPAAAAFWGRSPAPGEKWSGALRLYRPEGAALRHDDSPLARTLRHGVPQRGEELVLERPDGARARFLPFPQTLHDAAGALTGALEVLIDTSDRERTEREAAQLAAIVTCSDDAIVSKSLTGIITSWNQGAARIFGYEPAEMVGQPITRIIPPELHDEERSILARISRGERIEHYETVRVAKDGRRIDVSLTVSPMRDRTGAVVGASKIGRDISERKRHEDLQRLLLNELNHRVKNTLATVQAMASQTLRRSGSMNDFVWSFNRRLQALARAHALVSHGKMQGAEFSDLVRDQLLLDGSDERISYSGPNVTLDAPSALQFALVLHELGTNARKYGALSSATGKLVVTWEVRASAGDPRDLMLHWAESGGPPVTAPSARGFGSRLIEQGLRAHGGDVTLRYGASGVTCDIKLPLPSHQEAEPRADAFRLEHVAAGGASALQGKRILVVEDEIVIAMDVMDKLRDCGCVAIGPAASVEEAMQLIDEAKFDAALLDANLSGRPVDDLAAAFAKRGTPFAFVTGYGREALPAAFQEAIMVAKPFSHQQLEDALSRVFARDTTNIAELRRKA